MELRHLLVAEGAKPGGLTVEEVGLFVETAARLGAGLYVPTAEARDGRIYTLTVGLPRLPVAQKPEF